MGHDNWYGSSRAVGLAHVESGMDGTKDLTRKLPPWPGELDATKVEDARRSLLEELEARNVYKGNSRDCPCVCNILSRVYDIPGQRRYYYAMRIEDKSFLQ